MEYATGHSELTSKDLASARRTTPTPATGFPDPDRRPGEASIKAALQPADGDWIYYVLATKAGEHAFTRSYDEFLKLKAQARAKGLL